jgi:hypothetical protein
MKHLHNYRKIPPVAYWRLNTFDRRFEEENAKALQEAREEQRKPKEKNKRGKKSKRVAPKKHITMSRATARDLQAQYNHIRSI